MLIIHRDESTKSEPTLVDMPVWLVHMNFFRLDFLASFCYSSIIMTLIYHLG